LALFLRAFYFSKNRDNRYASDLIALLNEAATRQEKQTTQIEPTTKVPLLLTALFGGCYGATRTNPL